MAKNFTVVYQVQNTKTKLVGFSSQVFGYDPDTAKLPKQNAVDTKILMEMCSTKKMRAIDICAVITEGDVLWEDKQLFDRANASMEENQQVTRDTYNDK